MWIRREKNLKIIETFFFSSLSWLRITCRYTKYQLRFDETDFAKKENLNFSKIFVTSIYATRTSKSRIYWWILLFFLVSEVVWFRSKVITFHWTTYFKSLKFWNTFFGFLDEFLTVTTTELPQTHFTSISKHQLKIGLFQIFS